MAKKKTSTLTLETAKLPKEMPVTKKQPVNQQMKSESPAPIEPVAPVAPVAKEPVAKAPIRAESVPIKTLPLPIVSAQAVPAAPTQAASVKVNNPAKKASPVKVPAAVKAEKPVAVSVIRAADKKLSPRDLPQDDFREIAAFGSENLEACVKSGVVMAKGMEILGKEVLGFTQMVVQANFQITKALLGVTTLNEVMDVQADYARQNVDNLLSESTKLTEMSVTVANQAFEPLQSRVNVTVEALLKQRAA